MGFASWVISGEFNPSSIKQLRMRPHRAAFNPKFVCPRSCPRPASGRGHTPNLPHIVAGRDGWSNCSITQKGHTSCQFCPPQFAAYSGPTGRAAQRQTRALTRWLLAPAVLALLLFSLQGTIQAQSPQTLVSNIGRSNQFGQDLGALDVAQEFTTGNNPTGYTLTSVDLKLQTLGATTVPSVKMVRHNPNHSSGVTLTARAVFEPALPGTTRSRPRRASHLEPATKYWVVVEGVLRCIGAGHPG